jgi:hypothetical protein
LERIKAMSETAESEPLRMPAWAHAAGILDLGPAVRVDGTEALIDRTLITERIARYCWGYDERRLELLSACFTEDGVWEGNVLGRVPVGPFVGRAAIASWLSEFWPHQHDQRRHMILNTIVEAQTAESATTLSYLLLMGSTGAVASIESMGFYKVAYRRVGDDWLISRLTAGFDKPFWPGQLENLSPRGRKRHGVAEDA